MMNPMERIQTELAGTTFESTNFNFSVSNKELEQLYFSKVTQHYTYQKGQEALYASSVCFWLLFTSYINRGAKKYVPPTLLCDI